MNYRIPTLVTLTAIVLFLSGCATRYPVRVDALSAGGSQSLGRGATYELVSDTPGVEESELFFKEVARALEPVLRNKGYSPAAEGSLPDFQIAVDAHLSEPITESQTYSEPVYSEFGGYMRSVRVPVVNAEGKVVRYAVSSYYVPRRSYHAGWVDQNRQYTVYDKILRLSARKILDEKTLSDEIWAITIQMRTESTDYRSALPYMLVAAGPYIGGHTDGEEVITITEDDDDLEAFKAKLAKDG
ncbi:MAG: hypothetical protein AB3N63_08260 [Puniceicoccaceae bacterium]